MAVTRYTSNRDINKYSVYQQKDNVVRQIVSNNDGPLHFAKNQHLQAVYSFAQQQLKVIQKKSIKYYVYGQNNIQLDAQFYASGGYNVIRKDTTGSEIITLGLVPVTTIKQYSKFSMPKLYYYMLASERFIISANTQYGQNYLINKNNNYEIKHNLSGIIDFSIKEYDLNTLSSSYEINVQNTVIDNCTLELELDSTKSYEVIIWKLDSFNSNIYKNVFSTYNYKPYEVDWNVYQNDEEFQLGLNYRFSFIGYMVKHDALINKKELVITQDVNNLSTTVASGANQLLPFSKTLNNNSEIQKNFTYVLNSDYTKSKKDLTKLLKVMLPDFTNYKNIGAQCKSIYIYSSIFSQTIYYDESMLTDNILIINHKLNGIVKAVIRNIRTDLYHIFYINDNKIKIEFVPNKLILKSGFVDLFLIWSKDNNEI